MKPHKIFPLYGMLTNCWVLSCCFLYVFTPEVVWLPVLQLAKAEDAYAPCEVTFGSRFQSPSFGPSGVREANKMANNINSLSSILLRYIIIKASSYTTTVNVLYKYTYILTCYRKRNMKPYNKMSKRKQYRGCRRQPLNVIKKCALNRKYALIRSVCLRYG